jgi:hypothetical protein
MVRLAAQTRVWCDRGRVILPRPGGAVFLSMPPLAEATTRQGAARNKCRIGFGHHGATLPSANTGTSGL